MRHAFIKALSEEAKKNEKIVLLTGDLGFKVLESFKDQFKDRFINIGVAEANLITVAAGLSRFGFIPFAYSIATFASMRPFEQIRNDVCLQNLNVKIVGVGAGLAYNKAGPTHHSMEDIAVMKSLSNMAIINPSDPENCYEATKQMVKHNGPAYIRIERNPETVPDINISQHFTFGKGQMVKRGKQVAILTTGTKIPLAFKISQKLLKKQINCAIYSFSTIAPLDKKLLSNICKEFSLLISIEEHRINGGFGSAIAEYLTDLGIGKKLLRFGFKNEFSPVSAEYESLMKYFNLDADYIARKILSANNW